MPMPKDIKAIDLMFGIPVSETNKEWYEAFKPLLLDKESQMMFKMPAQYMFRDIPPLEKMDNYVDFSVEQMDKFNIEKVMVGFYESSPSVKLARDKYPDRFIFEYGCNPNRGMDEVFVIKRLHKEYGIKAVSVFPAGLCPQVPINDKKMYPIYAACCELDIPILVNVGVPGPRVPIACQMVELVDEVCWFFPELKVVMRHGGEPWEALAVKLMLRYPNLYYSTSAFAPKHYPKAIINYANTRGADKILYSGYFPMGLSLERIFSELENVPFKDSVWPKFLRENAKRVFKI